MTSTSETDIAAPVVAWLQAQHWEVYQEVERHTGGQRADIVAIRGNLVWVLEVKSSLSLAVLAQAASWPVYLRSVVVPATKRQPFRADKSPERAFAERLCKQHLHLGLITVNVHATQWENPVHVVLEAPLQRRFDWGSKELSKRCLPGHQTHAVAGSARGGHFTPYRNTMEGVRNHLRKFPTGLTIRQIFDALGKGHYMTDASAKSQLRHCLETYETDWCIVDKAIKPWIFRVRTPADGPAPTAKTEPRFIIEDPWSVES